MRRRPIATLGMLASLSLVFLFQLVLSQSAEHTSAELMPLVYIPTEVLSRPWTLVTYAFLHAGIFHVLGNLYFLYVFGDNIEDTLGRRKFFLIYALAAIVGALAQGVVDSTTPVIGASGAIAGLMGAYLVLFPRIKVFVVIVFLRVKISIVGYMAAWIGYQLMLSTLSTSIAWMVHLGGFATGALLALPYRSRPLAELLKLPARQR